MVKINLILMGVLIVALGFCLLFPKAENKPDKVERVFKIGKA